MVYEAVDRTVFRKLALWASLLLLVLPLASSSALGKGKPGKGNQPLPGTADFLSGDLMSNGTLEGGFVDHSSFQTLGGELGAGETLTVAGNPGVTLGELGSSVLPPGALVSPAGCDLTPEPDCQEVFFDESTGASWTIRLDPNREPTNRVQLKLNWLNEKGELHHLRIGWFVDNNPLLPDDYGELTSGTSLRDARIEFFDDPFRIDGRVFVGKGKKKALMIYSHYYVDKDGDGVFEPGEEEDGVASCTIQTVVFE